MRFLRKHIPKGANNPEVKIIPTHIVIHYTGQAGVSAERLALCLFNNNANNVSANFCVDEKAVIECIPAGYMSYGVTGENGHIINIEVCYKDDSGRFELETIANLRRIVRLLMNNFNIPATNVVRHYDMSPYGKKCPVYYVNNPNEWDILHSLITKGVM